MTEDSGTRTGRGEGRRAARDGARRGRAARAAERKEDGSGKLGYIRRKIPYYEPFDEETLVLIENNTDIVLEEIGIEFRNDEEVLSLWKDAGADVKGERVRIPKGLCRKLLETAPHTFTQHARNSERSVEFGGKNTIFAPVYGPPFV
ncbi:MAG: trimethylamine methyltransferase family protein, partial [Hyphomicrobiales bacterium]|nr:trimethylamine methyltransferase family protein [Hyphomicrobiales bacterium]